MEARASEVFVGRARELEELERALDATRAGSGATVLVTGEAGIGKTRLASELASRARDAGFEVLVGRSIDLVGTELPYQPFVEALRPLGERRPVDDGRLAAAGVRGDAGAAHASAPPPRPCCSCSRICTGPTRRRSISSSSSRTTSTTGRVLLLATYRADEPSSAERMRRLADGVRRSGSALVLELGPLEHDELTALLAARADAPLPAALADTIVARSEGNPFFAEELLAAAGDGGRRAPAWPARPAAAARRPRSTVRRRSVLRLAAAAGRDVGYPLLRATAGLPERDLRESLRRAVEHGVLVAEPGDEQLPLPPRAARRGDLRDDPAGRARGAARAARRRARTQRRRRRGGARTALGGRGSQHGGARRVGRSGPPGGGRLRPRRGAARTSSGRSRSGTPCRTRPSSPGSTSPSSAPGRPSSPARSGAAPRAVELARRAIELVGEGDPHARRAPPRAPRPVPARERHATTPALAACRACGRARAGAAAVGGARVGAGVARRRIDAGLALRRSRCRSASRRSRSRAPSAHARPRSGRSRCSACDLAYLGRGDEGVARSPAGPAARRGERRPRGLERAYVASHRRADDAGAASRVGAGRRGAGSTLMRRYGIDSTVLVANRIEALVAIGDWDEADRLSAAALRGDHRQLPVHAAHHPRRPRDRPRRVRRRASAPRGRTRHAARGPRARPLRRLPRRARPLGAPLDRRRRGHRRTALARARSPTSRPDPRLALRQGAARAGRARGARARPPRCRGRPIAGSRERTSCVDVARRAAAEAVGGHAERRRLARAGRGRARARPRHRAARVVVGRRRDAGSGSSARRSRPTAAGARPRRSSPRARPRVEASMPAQ